MYEACRILEITSAPNTDWGLRVTETAATSPDKVDQIARQGGRAQIQGQAVGAPGGVSGLHRHNSVAGQDRCNLKAGPAKAGAVRPLSPGLLQFPGRLLISRSRSGVRSSREGKFSFRKYFLTGGSRAAPGSCRFSSFSLVLLLSSSPGTGVSMTRFPLLLPAGQNPAPGQFTGRKAPFFSRRYFSGTAGQNSDPAFAANPFPAVPSARLPGPPPEAGPSRQGPLLFFPAA